ncbi:hypothetical protein GF373_13150 [bacterium]|nr:hypothetical protein [bacterium]
MDHRGSKFLFLTWPGSGSLFHNNTQRKEHLINAWYESHIPAFIDKSLNVVVPEPETIEGFERSIQTLQPDCLEGDFNYIQEVINRDDTQYIPILAYFDRDSPQAQLIFRHPQNRWEEPLGVIHPQMTVGGRQQIQFWSRQTGETVEWVPFYSTEEVLRHFLAGSIQAAAVPEDVLWPFLSKQNRQDLAGNFTQVRIPVPFPPIVIFLREDCYDTALMRTVVQETWLRNLFPHLFRALPAALTEERLGRIYQQMSGN